MNAFRLATELPRAAAAALAFVATLATVVLLADLADGYVATAQQAAATDSANDRGHAPAAG